MPITVRPSITIVRGDISANSNQSVLVFSDRLFEASNHLSENAVSLNTSPHKLRHTFCKNLIEAGVSLEKVAMLAGHENLETTRRYCSPSDHDLEAAVELIGGFE